MSQINESLFYGYGGTGSFNDRQKAYFDAIASTPQGQTSSSGLSPWWGVNGHFTWSWTPNAAGYFKANWAYHCLRLRDLGMSRYFNGYSWYYNDTTHAMTGSDANAFVDFITNYANPAGIKVVPVLLPSYDKSWLTTEQIAYDFAFSAGVETATALKGLVDTYICGNELEVWALTGSRGNYYGDFDNAKFIILRGVVRGLIAGVKSVDPTAKIGCPGGAWIHWKFHDMLLHGQQPDNTFGHPTVDWDITIWHWYTSNFAGNDDPELEAGQGPNMQLPTLASWGKPIWITEFGSKSSSYGGDETALSNAITGQYLATTFYNTRQKYNIQHIAYYQLVDAAAAGVATSGDELKFGLIGMDGTTAKARYAALKSFIATHQ